MSNNEIIPNFCSFIQNLPLVAHNSNFDVRFLTYYANLLDLEVINQSIDTIPLLKNLYPNLKNYKLGTVHEFFGFDLFDHHRAFDDAKITSKIFVEIQKKYGALGLGNFRNEN